MSDLSPIAVVVCIKRLPGKGESSRYAWTMEHAGEYVDGGDDLESIQACLMDIAIGVSIMTARIRVVYRGVEAGTFTVRAPSEITDCITKMYRMVVDARMQDSIQQLVFDIAPSSLAPCERA